MIKNILIVVLIGISAFLLTNNKESNKDNLEDVSENSPKNEVIKTSSADKLDLSGQGLKKLPEDVTSKTNLEELDISDNELTGALPSQIQNLKKLRVLDMSNNFMTGIPAEVGQLENLEILNLSNNKFTGLPYELGNLKNLKVLDLSGNNYAEQDLEVIKQSLPLDVEIIL